MGGSVFGHRWLPQNYAVNHKLRSLEAVSGSEMPGTTTKIENSIGYVSDSTDTY